MSTKSKARPGNHQPLDNLPAVADINSGAVATNVGTASPERFTLFTKVTGESHEETKRCAWVHFKAYLAKKMIAETDETSVCNVAFWQEFAGYLATSAVSKRGGGNLKASTVVNYLGAAKEVIRKSFPTNKIWLNHDEEILNKNLSGTAAWFTELRMEVERRAFMEAIKIGMSVENKAFPCGRDAVAKGVKYFLGKNTRDGICKAVYIVTTLLTIGRACEAGWASWNQSFIQSIEGTIMNDVMVCYH
jgi:hypothetical protein